MILFVFICKRFFQPIIFIFETKLKGHDGIALCKSWHFPPNFIGTLPEVGETHADGGFIGVFFVKELMGFPDFC